MPTIGELIERASRPVTSIVGGLASVITDVSTCADGLWHQLRDLTYYATGKVIYLIPDEVEAAKKVFETPDRVLDNIGVALLGGTALKGDALVDISRTPGLRFYQRFKTLPMAGLVTMMSADFVNFSMRRGYDLGYRWSELGEDWGKDIVTALLVYGLGYGINRLTRPIPAAGAAPVAAAGAAPAGRVPAGGGAAAGGVGGGAAGAGGGAAGAGAPGGGAAAGGAGPAAGGAAGGAGAAGAGGAAGAPFVAAGGGVVPAAGVAAAAGP